MSRGIRGNILVGESGDVLIKNPSRWRNIPHEVVENDTNYIRLLNLPVIRQVDDWINKLLMLTQDGRILIIDDDSMKISYIDLDVPPIKMIYYLDPILVLDVTNTLHVIDLPWIVHQQFQGKINVEEYYNDEDEDEIIIKPSEFEVKKIDNIKHVSCIEYIRSLEYPDNLQILILTNDGLYISGPTEYMFKSVNTFNKKYIHKIDHNVIKMNDNMMLTDDNKIIQYNPQTGSFYVEVVNIEYEIDDLILSGIKTYTIDSSGILRLYDIERNGNPNGVFIINIDFKAVRFLIDHDRVAVEDDGGNIYLLSTLELIPYPIRLINLQDDPFKGRMIKKAVG